MTTHISLEQMATIAEQTLNNILKQNRPLTNKERLAIPSQEMPQQEPQIRKNNIQEVTHGYTSAQARLEAMRCLQCKNAPCITGCPVQIKIPEFIKEIAEGKFQNAIDIIKTNSLLPAVCGRVCPQETQCQEPCTVGKILKDPMKSVAIGRLERFVADWEREHGKESIPQTKTATNKKIAIVGSGPAGLVTATDLCREGHQVTIFEAFHKPGGVMVYGIPEFRLPKSIVKKEIEILKKMGVELKTDFVVGRTRKLNDLITKDGFDAIFVGTGAGLPTFMNIEGENLVGVFSANEYLTRANLMKAYDREHAQTPIYRSQKVAVLGGGNVAMDAARTAVRLGAKQVSIIYRRSEKEMPARIEECEHAKEEGVIFQNLTNAKRFIGDSEGRLQQMECLRYKLGEPDESGRRRPIPIPNSEFIIDIDTAIIAIGNSSNPLIEQTTPGLKTNKWHNIVVDQNGKTSIDAIYAGGDIVLGAATVILAMGEGRNAAKAINRYLAKK